MIEIKNLQVEYEDVYAINNINLTINKGEKVVIIGPSGSGKSTLLRSINFLEKITAGEIWIEGKLYTDIDPYLHDDLIEKTNTYHELISQGITSDDALKQIKENFLLVRNEGKVYNTAVKNYYKINKSDEYFAHLKMGMVFQHFNLFNNLTVLDNLTLAPVITKIMTKDAAVTKAISLLNRIGLESKKDVYPSKLSGGQKQRIAILRSLMMNPEIILFDEPTSALDPEMIGEVLDLIKEVAKTGMTMVFVTHEMNFAREIADKIVFINEGEIEKVGTPEEVLNCSDNQVIKEFLSKVI